jgi:hypothetical protein
MPNSFQFIDKQTNEAEKFSIIDDKLRVHMGAPPNDEMYYAGWYDAFGELAAMGKSFAEMKVMYEAEGLLNAHTRKLLNWFDEHYRTTAWYMPKVM